MYRAVGWRVLDLGLRLDDEEAVVGVAERAWFELDGGRVIIDGHDVTAAIRTPQIDRAATAVARLSRVRAVLVSRQRALGAGGGVVMEGRDIGTAVFPDADVKLYLDASPEERARRRASDPAHTMHGTSIDQVATALKSRDESDRTRAASPLTVAPDAHVVDTTGIAADEVVRQVLEWIGPRVAGNAKH